MTKKCIICNKPSGSKEHIFPAALGGRRVNKNIYCETHNQAFGVHVSALLETLEYFNASLGVRSDHRNSPKPHTIELETGEKYQVLRDRIDIAPPLPLQKTPELAGKEVTHKFPNKIQYQEWVKKQRKDGFHVKLLSESPVQKQYFVEPIKFSLNLGGEDFRRAIAYVGLTYLAHYEPTLATQAGLSSIKSCVLGDAPVGDRVWWVDSNKLESYKESDFDGIHFISLVISSDEARAYAIVALFGSICMSIDLGPVESDKSECITTYINPMAERAGPDSDIFVTRTSIAAPYLGTPQESALYLSKIVGGEVANPVGEILKFLHDRQLDALTTKIISRLNLVINEDSKAIEEAIASIIEEQSQRILNLLQFGINEFVQRNNSLPENIEHRLARLIELDVESGSGLSSAGLALLERAKSSIANEVFDLLVAGELSEDKLKMLLAGGTGVAAALKPVFEDLLASLAGR